MLLGLPAHGHNAVQCTAYTPLCAAYTGPWPQQCRQGETRPRQRRDSTSLCYGCNAQPLQYIRYASHAYKHSTGWLAAWLQTLQAVTCAASAYVHKPCMVHRLQQQHHTGSLHNPRVLLAKTTLWQPAEWGQHVLPNAAAKKLAAAPQELSACTQHSPCLSSTLAAGGTGPLLLPG
jgi:hypothetical protein